MKILTRFNVILRLYLSKFSQKTLIAFTTFCAIISTLVIVFLAYKVMGVALRSSELIVGVLAPMLVAPLFTWYLFGLLLELDRKEKEIRELATYDILTGVLTRWAFMLKAAAYVEIAKRYEKSFALLTVDLDNFKKINDTYGHSVGDEVLRMFGIIVKQETRKSDMVGRIGGDEFIFLLAETDTEGAQKFAGDLHMKINKTPIVLINRDILQYTVSIGVSIYRQALESQTLQTHIEQSDEALYIAKSTGRNKTVFYQERSDKQVGKI